VKKLTKFASGGRVEKMHKIKDLETNILERLLAQVTNITIKLGKKRKIK